MFDDVITGDAGDNTLRGYAGYDTLAGGEGMDAVDFFDDPTTYGVTVNLAEGWAIDGYLDTNSLTSIERVYGSFGNDIITGSAADNFLQGRAGFDYLDGGTGFNSLSGGIGDDYLFDGGERDWLVGGDGNDMLDGTSVAGDTEDYDTAGYVDEVDWQGGTQGVFVYLYEWGERLGDRCIRPPDTLSDIEEVWAPTSPSPISSTRPMSAQTKAARS